MKKTYFNPEIKFVEFDSADLICTSGGFEGIGEGDPNGEASARQRRTSIWDDEF